MILSISASLTSPVIKSLFPKTLYHGSAREALLLQTLSLIKKAFARGSKIIVISYFKFTRFNELGLNNRDAKKCRQPSGIFLFLLKCAYLNYGGFYAKLAFFEIELVEKRSWLNHDGFPESVVIGRMVLCLPIMSTGIF